MTKNTLRFITPLKVCAKIKKDNKHLEPNAANPATWTNEMLRTWMQNQIKNLDVDEFCPFETGKQILTIPENAFLTRLMSVKEGLGEKKAKYVYDKLWACFIDFRNKNKYGF